MHTPTSYAVVGEINGLIYIAGGDGGTITLPNLQVYDPAKDWWDSRRPMPKDQRGFAGRLRGAGAVINGKLYVAGGWNNNEGWRLPTETLFIYDPTTNNWGTGKPPGGGWTAGANMPLRSGTSIAGMIGGKLYVYTQDVGAYGFDHRRFHVYDSATNVWKEISEVTHLHRGGAGGVIGGKFYMVGGSYVVGNADLNQKKQATLDVTTLARTHGNKSRRCRQHGRTWPPPSWMGKFTWPAARTAPMPMPRT
jgi:N-acetylneuraminic acid mutarotase